MNSSELIAAFAELYEDGYINQMTKKKVNATNKKYLQIHQKDEETRSIY
jgi:hypothetical protein